MATSQIGQLRTENANRKVWLVKVPNFVAKQWKEVSEKAINEDHEAIGPKLASVLMSETGPAGKAPSYVLHLSEEQQSFGHPTEYRMNVTTRNAAPMVAFSQEGQRLACEGTVYQKFDLEVSQKGLEVDPAYRALNRERHKAAAVKNRSVQLVSDHKVTNARQPVYIGAGSKKSTGGSKRLAKPKEDLERELFQLFEKQARWHFVQLQKQTDQPTMHLKSVLIEIAFQNKRGPYKDLWEIKKELRAGGGHD